MKALVTGSTLATVVAVASVIFVLGLLAAGGVAAGVAGYGCW